jgi:hypothetical protein
MVAEMARLIELLTAESAPRIAELINEVLWGKRLVHVCDFPDGHEWPEIVTDTRLVEKASVSTNGDQTSLAFEDNHSVYLIQSPFSTNSSVRGKAMDISRGRRFTELHGTRLFSIDDDEVRIRHRTDAGFLVEWIWKVDEPAKAS